MSQPLREYAAEARSSGTFGRVLASARHHEILVDGPVWNGCPGEEVMPGELFLGGVATCAVELIEVIARDRGVPVRGVSASIRGVLDPANRAREDVMVFNRVDLRLTIEGASDADAAALVEAFKGR